MDTNEIVFKKSKNGVWDYLGQGLEMIRDRYWLFFGITAVGILIGSLAPFAILWGPMMCGIFLCFQKKVHGEEVKFELLFKGFDYFLESLLATLIWFGLMLAAAIPLTILFILTILGMTYAFHQDLHSLQLVTIAFLALLILLSLVLLCFLAVPLQFAYILIIERRLKPWEAVKTAFSACWLNFSKIIGLGCTIMLLSMIGMLCCYIGLFFIQPLLMGAYFSAYRDMFEPPAPPAMPS